MNSQERITPAVVSPGVVDRWRAGLPDVPGHIIFWSLLLVGLALDLWTKRAVFDWLADKPQQSMEIIPGFLTFRLALNSGAAFGIASGRMEFLIGVSAVALIIIIGVFLLGGVRQRSVQVSLGLFAAGVSGNLWDRVFNGGHVRDFIDVVYWPGRHWHTFNLADALLCTAVGLLIVATFLTDSSDRTHGPPQR